jgi:hypothetical protein
MLVTWQVIGLVAGTSVLLFGALVLILKMVNKRQ